MKTATGMQGGEGVRAAGIRKEVLMVHNLQLLGFSASGVDAPAEATKSRVVASTTKASVRTSGGSEAMVAAPLHAGMFDRPNEKMLFPILHFLLLKIDPQVEQELRFCWPFVTPQDRSTFKRLTQTTLHELEKKGILPLGSSQASRLNTGSGPRVVDLIWRVSTHVVKMTLMQKIPSGHRKAALPGRDQIATREAVQLLKAKLAMKTRRFKEQCVARSQVQDQWISFADTLSEKIQEVSASLARVYEQQSQLDARVDRSIYSQVGAMQRQTKLEDVNESWAAIHSAVTSTTHRENQFVLETARQYHGNQPVLDADQLQPPKSFVDRRGPLNLVDIVKNADAIIQLTRQRLAQHDASQLLTQSDTARMEMVQKESSAHIANLTTMVEQLQQLLSQIQSSNASATRELCIQVAATAASGNGDDSLRLCPPTPADQVLRESDLVQSLKKCSIHELSKVAAQSLRSSADSQTNGVQPALGSNEFHESTGSYTVEAEDPRLFRKLEYDLDDETMD